MKGPQRPAGMELETRTPAKVEEEIARARTRRDNARWTVVMGMAMLFGAAFHWALAAGGAAMTMYGGASYVYWSRRMTAMDDPWQDEEIDAWEREYVAELEGKKKE
jgi:hypothetical protein